MTRMKKKKIMELATLAFGVEPIVWNMETQKQDTTYFSKNLDEFVPFSKKYSTIRSEDGGEILSRVLSSITVEGNIELFPF